MNPENIQTEHPSPPPQFQQAMANQWGQFCHSQPQCLVSPLDPSFFEGFSELLDGLVHWFGLRRGMMDPRRVEACLSLARQEAARKLSRLHHQSESVLEFLDTPLIRRTPHLPITQPTCHLPANPPARPPHCNQPEPTPQPSVEPPVGKLSCRRHGSRRLRTSSLPSATEVLPPQFDILVVSKGIDAASPVSEGVGCHLTCPGGAQGQILTCLT